MIDGPRTSFGIVQESIRFALGRWFSCKLCEQIRTCKKKPAHIARVVHNLFEIGPKTVAPGSSGVAFSPRTLVFFIGPIHFCNHYGRKISNRFNLLVPLLLKHLIAIGATKPARIDMYGIADIFAFYGIKRKTFVLRLVARTRNPEHIVKAIFAYFIDDGLENLLQHIKVRLGIRTFSSIGQANPNRLIGQLKHDFIAVPYFRMLRHNVPNRHQVLRIVVIIFHSNDFG